MIVTKYVSNTATVIFVVVVVVVVVVVFHVMYRARLFESR